MLVSQIKKEMIFWGKTLYDKGMSPATSGNISVKINNEEREEVLISASGSALGYLNEDDIVLIDFEGNVIEGTKKPSMERFLHIEIYKTDKNTGAIIHAHPPKLSVLAIAGEALTKPLLSEFVFHFGNVPCADYAMPSSRELAVETAKYFKEHTTVLMKNHGAAAAAKTLKEAFFKLETAEAYAETLILSELYGKQNILSDEQVNSLLALKKQL